MEPDLRKRKPAGLIPRDREKIHQVILEVCKPIAPFWPMRTMGEQGPIQELEYLPLEQAIRIAQHFLGGQTGRTNEEYRQLYREGRITQENLKGGFQRIRPRQQRPHSIQIENRQITVLDVWWVHLIGGFEPIEPARLEWELGKNGSTKQFHLHLSEESRHRINARTIQECELCREYPEKAYLENLWKTTLLVLQLSESPATPQQIDRSDSPKIETDSFSLPAQRTMSEWVDSLAGVGLVGQVNDQLRKWGLIFLDERVADREMSLRGDGFYQAWRRLVQEDDSGTHYRIEGFTQRVNDLPTDPEDTIASSLQHLGIPQERWREYLARQLTLLPGWMTYIRWLGAHPDYSAQSKHPIDITHYLAVRMFYEVELVQLRCQQEWGIDGTVPSLTVYWNDQPKEYDAPVGKGLQSVAERKRRICREAWRLFHLAQFLELSPIEMLDLSFTEAQTFLQWLDDFPLNQHSLVWLEAYEGFFGPDHL